MVNWLKLSFLSINIRKELHNIQLKEYLFMIFVNESYCTYVTEEFIGSHYIRK